MSGVRTVLHIGSDKTGSTALQHALASGRQELTMRGVLYPDIDGRPDHLSFAEGARPNWPRLPDVDTMIVSSEALWPLGQAEVESVLAALPAGTTDVVAYVREPGAYVEAAFLQRCRMCTSERGLRAAVALLALPPAINPIAKRAIRRFGQLGRWADAADGGTVDRLVLRPYLPTRWPERDIVSDFCDAIGRKDIEPLLADRAHRVQNPTPDLTAIHASVLIRSSSGQQAQTRFLRLYSEGVLASPPSAPAGPYLRSSLRDHVRRAVLPHLVELHERHGGLEPLVAPAETEAGQQPTPGRFSALNRDAALRLAEQFSSATNEGGQR